MSKRGYYLGGHSLYGWQQLDGRPQVELMSRDAWNERLRQADERIAACPRLGMTQGVDFDLDDALSYRDHILLLMKEAL